MPSLKTGNRPPTATDLEKKGMDVIDFVMETHGEKKYQGEHEYKTEINILRASFE